jgi:hypothetical protein
LVQFGMISEKTASEAITTRKARAPARLYSCSQYAARP